MALPTLHHRTAATRPSQPPSQPPTLSPGLPAALPDAARELVLTAPMLLFAHGILAWIDDLGGHGGSGVLWFLAQAALIGAAFSFVGLGAGLRHVTAATAAQSRPLSTAALAGAIVGTGLTTWVALVRGIGGAAATTGAPEWLLGAGPVLLAASILALVALARPVLELPRRTVVLGATAAVLVLLPLDLVPLAAIVLLLSLEPLLEREPAALDADRPAGVR
jgi:hypothetical protein